MNNEYYMADICFDFEANSDDEAKKKFFDMLKASGISPKNACLKKFKRNTLGDFGEFIVNPYDDEYNEYLEE